MALPDSLSVRVCGLDKGFGGGVRRNLRVEIVRSKRIGDVAFLVEIETKVTLANIARSGAHHHCVAHSPRVVDPTRISRDYHISVEVFFGQLERRLELAVSDHDKHIAFFAEL